MTATGVDLCPDALQRRWCTRHQLRHGRQGPRLLSARATRADYATRWHLQPDGKVLLGGSCYAQAATGFDFCLIRVDPATATLDTTFNGTGKRRFHGFARSTTSCAASRVQADGRIIAAGSCGMGNATTAEDSAGSGCCRRGNRIAPSLATPTGLESLPLRLVAVPATIALTPCCCNRTAIWCSWVVASATWVACWESACLARYQGGPFGYTACTLDLDGDGQYHPLIDGLLRTRILLGFNDSRALSGIRLACATRNNWNLIASHLARHCGVRGLSWTELSLVFRVFPPDETGLFKPRFGVVALLPVHSPVAPTAQTNGPVPAPERTPRCKTTISRFPTRSRLYQQRRDRRRDGIGWGSSFATVCPSREFISRNTRVDSTIIGALRKGRRSRIRQDFEHRTLCLVRSRQSLLAPDSLPFQPPLVVVIAAVAPVSGASCHFRCHCGGHCCPGPQVFRSLRCKPF